MNSYSQSHNEVGLNYAPFLMQETSPLGTIRRRENTSAEPNTNAERSAYVNASKRLPLHKVLSCFITPSMNTNQQENKNFKSCHNSPRACNDAQNGNTVAASGGSNGNLSNYTHNNMGNINLNAIPGYNGNYEGDVSMLGGHQQQYKYEEQQQHHEHAHTHPITDEHEVFFTHQLSARCISRKASPRNSLLRRSELHDDTDSEQESLRELNDYLRTKSQTRLSSETKPLPMTLTQLMGQRVLPLLMSQQRQDKLRGICQRIYASTAFQFLLLLLQSLCALLGVLALYVWRSLMFVLQLLSNLWRSFHLRNTTRKILWHVTLAKCGDTALYALIVCTTPWIFLMGVVGLVMAVLFELKKIIFELFRLIRLRLMF